jgi:hypothetical protein
LDCCRQDTIFRAALSKPRTSIEFRMLGIEPTVKMPIMAMEINISIKVKPALLGIKDSPATPASFRDRTDLDGIVLQFIIGSKPDGGNAPSRRFGG